MSEPLSSNQPVDPMSLQNYFLTCLAEECAEVIHAVSKALRFGLDHEWPGRGCTNRTAITEELRDAFKVAERLEIDWAGFADKGEKFDRMMELSRTLGRLTR